MKTAKQSPEEQTISGEDALEAVSRAPHPVGENEVKSPSETPRKPRRYAVIVGINDYQGTASNDLKFCSNDAEALYDALNYYSLYEAEQMALFSDGEHSKATKPTYSDILSKTREFADEAGEQDTILFFFAGHGTRNEEDSFLLTKEYRPNILAETSIALSAIASYFSTSKARFVMMFLDACHSGRLGQRGAAEDELPGLDIESLKAPQAEGWARLAACKEDESAYELDDIGHGIFSFYLVRALQGDASTDQSRVTLDNVKAFVMDNIIETARKIGVKQTPVFCGDQAGQMIMALVRDKAQGRGPEEQMPQSLQRISKFKIETIVPETDDVPPLLLELKNLLKADTNVERYIAQSQSDKLDKMNEFTQAILSWMEERAKQSNEQIGGELFSAEIINVENAPNNGALAKALYSFKVLQNLEWSIKTRSVTKYRKEVVRDSLMSSFMGTMGKSYPFGKPAVQYEEVPYQVDVADSVSQSYELPNSTVVLQFENVGHAVPKCALVVAVIPSTIGFYSYAYLASSEMEAGMTEEWKDSSFSRRFFIINRLDRPAFDGTKSQLDEAFAQFISFIMESAKGRRATFLNMGISEEKQPASEKIE